MDTPKKLGTITLSKQASQRYRQKKEKIAPYHRYTTVEIDELIQALKESRTELEKDGHVASLTSNRIRTFSKGVKCVFCGLEAKFAAFEEGNNRRGILTGNTHINVYAINTKGEEVMMTSDHIVAKARGGGEGLDNRQPMCSVCNNGKGAMELDSLEELEKIPPSHRALMSNLSLASVEDLQYKLEEDRLAIENAMAKLAEEDETRDWNEVLEKRTKTYLATKQELSTRATQPKKSNSEAGGSWDVGSLFD